MVASLRASSCAGYHDQMRARRILLIDNDPSFHRLLHEQLGAYQFEIQPCPLDAENPLAAVKELSPALIFIGVEMPDKVGFALCNKVKKGAAKAIPVVLTTASIPAAGFAGHRRLKARADEYHDKRTETIEQLLAKVDQLVGLGERIETPAPMDADEVEVDIEELDMDEVELITDFDDDIEVEAASAEFAAPAPEGGGADLGAEMDGAFAGIGADSPDAANETSSDDLDAVINDFSDELPTTMAAHGMPGLDALPINPAPPAEPTVLDSLPPDRPPCWLRSPSPESAPTVS